MNTLLDTMQRLCSDGKISFDVQFTIDLIKGGNIAWPRAENDELELEITSL